MRTREMCANSEPTPAVPAGDLPFTVNVSRHGRHRVVQISGELDVVTRNIVRRACLAGRRTAVVVEMSDMTFMDCSGYGGLVAARSDLQKHGGSLTLRNQAGQPAELLTMIELLEARR
jgi:anti-sigma B factor antagonist